MNFFDRWACVPLVGTDEVNSYVLGTAIIIHKCIAITAKHVLEENLIKFCGPNWRTSDTLRCDFHLVLPAILPTISDVSLFQATAAWAGDDQDIAILFITSRDVEDVCVPFKIDLVPPSVGQRVSMYGFPNTQAIDAERSLRLRVNPTSMHGKVLEIHPLLRDPSMVKWPAFTVSSDRPAMGGMSGGPVFNEEGNLCGIIASSMEGGDTTTVTSLWPLLSINVSAPLSEVSLTFDHVVDTMKLPVLHRANFAVQQTPSEKLIYYPLHLCHSGSQVVIPIGR